MEVYLAGYNLDTDTINDIKNGKIQKDNLTPETISAAYARISRDKRPVNILREVARSEVEKSRKSNKSIIFGLGHSSVAEHACFNFDVLGLSRFAIEALENFRLASFTEKSQRYITLDKDCLVPEEIIELGYKEEFERVINLQNNFYLKSFEVLTKYMFEKHEELLSQSDKNITLLEGWAKEDARYITSLATCGQLGMTVNARTLESMVKRFASSPLKEVRDLGLNLYKVVEKIAPSIIKYVEPNSFDLNVYENIKKSIGNLEEVKEKGVKDDVVLVDYSNAGDDFLVASFMHKVTNKSFNECKNIASNMTVDAKTEIIKASCKDMNFFDSVLREYEFPSLTYDLTVSAACFGQLKRHRMATIIKQDYNLDNGVTIPESIENVGLKNEFLDVTGKTEDLYSKIIKDNKDIAPYVLTNAHKRRVLMKVNPRALYHISRLREDAHAQWDIRNIARVMSREACEVMPLTFKLIGGKDKYAEVYDKIYSS